MEDEGIPMPAAVEEKESAVESEDDEEESSETRSLTAATGGTHASSAWAGRTVTLQMLLSTGILKPEKSSMAIEYMGQKFMGDLLPDGKIKSVETETVFCSPSAWAISCKRIINPEKKSGSGWASVKYKGKKLDYYKQMYLRKMQSQKECSPSDDEPDVSRDVKETSPPPPIKRHILTHNTINNRHITHDANSLVEAVTFANLGKLQPFHMSIGTSALLIVDLHSHLTKTEVSGYLGGTWDTNTHTLSITHAFPVRNSQWDREKAAEVELAIKKQMAKQSLTLVGWYHSHPRSPAQPTLRDIDAQLDYQIKMRGPTEATYSPCVGIICSPYYQSEETSVEGSSRNLESSLMAYWVVPPSENKPHEYGRPMMMTYSLLQDKELTEDVVSEMRKTMAYYKELNQRVLVKLDEEFQEGIPYTEKIKTSVFPKFPKTADAKEVWNIVREGLELEPEEQFEVPNCEHSMILAMIKKEEAVVKEEAAQQLKNEAGGAPTPLSQISSLQEQLNMPSGLNMNPILFSQNSGSGDASGPQPQNSDLENHVNSSPITIPSSSASPAKFEVPPVRMSPSPAKSDTTVSTVSSSRARNSPAPSPRLGRDEFRGSPSITSIPGLTITPSSSSGAPLKGAAKGISLEALMASGGVGGDQMKPTATVNYEGGSAAAAAQNMNELFSASLASLSKTLPPGLLSGGAGAVVDYQNLFGSPQAGGGGGSGAGGRGEKEPRDRSNSSNKSQASEVNYSMTPSTRDSNNSQRGGEKSASSAATAAAAQLAKEKFTIEQLMQSPVVPPHLKELLSQIDQNDLNFILAHPMFNNPEFLNALMPKGGESVGSRGGGGGGSSRDKESRAEREAPQVSITATGGASDRGSGGRGNSGGSSRTSGAGKQSSSSYGGSGSSGSSGNAGKEPKGYYDTHQLPSSLISQQAAAQQQQQQQQIQQKANNKSNAAAAAAAAQNLMMMSQYEEANKQLAELIKSPEYAMMQQQMSAMYGGAAGGMGGGAAGFDAATAAMLAGHFPGPVPQPPGQSQGQNNNQGSKGGSGGGGGGSSGKKNQNSKGQSKSQQQAAAVQQQQAAAAAAMSSALGLPPMDLHSLLKMPEMSALLGSGKPSEIAMLQQQMAQQMMREADMHQAVQAAAAASAQGGGGGGGGGRRGGGGGNRGGGDEARKQQQSQQQQMAQQLAQHMQQQEINALFKLPDLTTITPISGAGGQGGGGSGQGGRDQGSSNNAAMAAALAAGLPPELAQLFVAQQQQQQAGQQQHLERGSGGGSGGGGGKKGDQGGSHPMMNPNNDMLATLLSIGKSQDLSQLLFPSGGPGGSGAGGQPTAKQLADLNAFFSHPPPGLGIGKSGSGGGRGGNSGGGSAGSDLAAAVSAAQDAMSLYPNISVSAGRDSSGSSSGGSSRKQQQQQQQQQAAAAVQQAQLLQFQQEQELANLYQQQMLKYPGMIPDPLSKSTLAANNLYMTPSAALMKMQQEALNSIMMKPPKAGGGSGGGSAAQQQQQQHLMASHLMGGGNLMGQLGSGAAPPPLSHSPLSERLLATTPTKSNSSASSSRGNSPQVGLNNPPVQAQPPKSYGFSAADLAISSVGSGGGGGGRTMTPSPKSTTSSSYGGGGGSGAADLSRKSMSPANLSVFGGHGEGMREVAPPPIKKRMEFSSIADLAAPPPAKVPKFDEALIAASGMRIPSVSPALSSTGSLTGRDGQGRMEEDN